MDEIRPRAIFRRLTLRIPFHRSSGKPPRKEARSVVRSGVAVRAKQIRKVGVRHMLRRPFQPGCLRGNSWPSTRVSIARRGIRPIWRHRTHRMFFILMASPFLAGQLRLPVWGQQLAPVLGEVGMRLRAQNIFPVQFPPPPASSGPARRDHRPACPLGHTSTPAQRAPASHDQSIWAQLLEHSTDAAQAVADGCSPAPRRCVASPPCSAPPPRQSQGVGFGRRADGMWQIERTCTISWAHPAMRKHY